MPDTYITISGDMWDGIAWKTMGAAVYMPLLLEANTAHLETVIFEAGTELTVPEVPAGAADSLPPWKR